MSLEQLETERLVLEPIVPEHAEILFPFVSDERLYEFMDDGPLKTVPELEDRYRRWSAGESPDGSEKWLNWAARLRGTDEYVGWLQATVRGSEAQIAYVIFVPFQKRRFASEASEAMIDHLIAAYHVGSIGVTIDPRNAASIQLARSLGFTPSGRDSHELRFALRAARHRAARTPTSME